MTKANSQCEGDLICVYVLDALCEGRCMSVSERVTVCIPFRSGVG